MLSRLLACTAITLTFSTPAWAEARDADAVDLAAARERAETTVKAMKQDEKTVITHGIMPLPGAGKAVEIPEDAIIGAGYIHGVPRLGIPALRETDASLGVSWVTGARKDYSTALPSAVGQASTWNDALIEQGGAMIGAEARAKGFNVLLAGGANLARDPRNGRTFEYFSEDPLLTGELAGSAIRGVQSNHIISTIKHFALNGQETGRKFVDVQITPAAAHESDLLAFQIGIEKGQPGSVMCAYNRVMGEQACNSDWLLNDVLKGEWDYPGFVMSDWGAVPSIDAAMNGLDQQSGEQVDPDVFFADKLAAKAKSDPAWAKRLDDMNARILTAIYATGLDKHPAEPGGKIDWDAHAAVTEEVARQGIVLLKNEGILPLAKTAKSIAVIGGYADGGVLSGAGSSQVMGEGGPAARLPVAGSGIWAGFISESYHRSSPMKAMQAIVPEASIKYRQGQYLTDAAELAARSEVAIVFATQWMTEGLDVPDLSLPRGQDALIAAVAAANPNTIVVLETGGPVKMPWLDKVKGVVEAWYPGTRGGEAIASVLFGDANPSGHLPLTFPADESQLPRQRIDGTDWVEPDFGGNPKDGKDDLPANFNIEGSDVGYRWFARTGKKPLFPFGYGLSYTSFAHGTPTLSSMTASVAVTNTGKRQGADVVQLYLVDRAGKAERRLVGYGRVDLAPGASQTVSMKIDPRLLADWKDGKWTIPAGTYTFAAASDAESLGKTVSVKMKARSWKD
ncbi:glycoside hydrolase family 3 C-terminal domain-containing protein [Novosphingobium sp. YJ-S2-02]|uniref:Glycoside hydrolase family 3 C-terminal domain-containing protein n=1 Tax=Novosphingobium aureum TaxID=2792964 RepID=A0A931HDC9_9SPHN|nr:glycoside hydrolase family 3 C-terminal domain-containing protein [Novosphingobium aureum]MBH0113368.1 glycoside hydrolase family 3 C-terminal domain-containing protein [Novosphingobium aureum]